MALIGKETITTNATEIYALYQAIEQALFKPIEYSQKLTVAQYLAVGPLRKAVRRLHSKLMNEHGRPHKVFPFSFPPEELLAIHLCISSKTYDQHLMVILGKIQQKVLNYDTRIELTPNP